MPAGRPRSSRPAPSAAPYVPPRCDLSPALTRGMQRLPARAAIHEVVVAWRRQEGDEFRESMRERDRSKVGRMARLRGQVETIAAVPLALANAQANEEAEQTPAEEAEKIAAE